MADPLSLIASIIAVVGAAEGVSKTLAKIKSIRDAPDELLALINEVSDLQIILGDVQNYIARHTRRPQIVTEELQHMSILVERAKVKLLKLDELIQYRLVKPDSALNQIKVSKREWLRAKTTIEKFRQSLRDIRLNIVAQMTVINSSHQSRISLTIEEIHMMSGQQQTNQQQMNQNGDCINQQLDEHSRLLTDILNSQSRLQGVLQLQNSPTHGPGTTTGDQSSNSIIRIRAYASQHQRSPCTPNCKCICHNVRSFQSPALLHNAIGTLFVGYSGYPIRALQRCTETGCISQSIFRGYVHYLFPSWFLIKALTITLMSIFLDEISISLVTRRIISSSAEIFPLIGSDDVEGVKSLLSLGSASPNDSYVNGSTVLNVCKVLDLIRAPTQPVAIYVAFGSQAVDRLKFNVCELLLKAGGDPHLKDFTAGSSPMFVAWNWIFAGSDGSNRLRSLFPITDDFLEEQQFSRLHEIVLGLTSHDLEEELRSCGSDIDKTDSNGNTALMWAARRGNHKMTGLLVRSGANLNLFKNKRGKSALLYAALLSDLRCVKLLCNAGADLTHVCHDRYNALHHAVQGHDLEPVIFLLKAGVHVNGRDRYGVTPLSLAAIYNDPDIAEALLDHGADINTKDNDGDTPLHESIHRNAKDAVHLLLSRGATYTVWDSNGDSILHQTAKSGDLGMLQVLQAASLKGIDPDALSRQGHTPIQLAEKRTRKPPDFVEEFQELLTDIRTRNAHLARNSDAASGGMSEDQASRLSRCIRLIRAKSTAWKLSSLNWIQDFEKTIQSMSHDPMPKTTWIYLLLSIFVVGFAYIYSTFGLDWVKHVFVMLWQMIGPGGMEEL